MGQQLLRLPGVMSKTGLAKATIYREIKLGKFPRSVPLIGRTRAWVESEVSDYIAKKIQARDTAKEAA